MRHLAEEERMGEDTLYLKATAAVTRLKALIAAHQLTPADGEAGHSGAREGLRVRYFAGQPWLRILSTECHRQWCLHALDGTYLTQAQWQEMRCFILSHTPQGCPEAHAHCGLPEGWHAAPHGSGAGTTGASHGQGGQALA